MVNAASVLGFARLEATARVGKSCRARAGVSSSGCRGGDSRFRHTEVLCQLKKACHTGGCGKIYKVMTRS